MAGNLGAQTMSSLRPATSFRRQKCRASLHTPVDPTRKSVYIPKLPTSMTNMEELVLRAGDEGKATRSTSSKPSIKLYTTADTVTDRAEMHYIIGEQRNNWNALLLSSINSITLTASLMAGIAAVPAVGGILPLKVSSVLLFTAATGMMAAVNKIQASQLAEEQRNATRLFRQLERSIRTTLALGRGRSPTEFDVEEALERIVAIEKAYPLPLLPLPDKFPKAVKPTVWWPKPKQQQQQQVVQEKRSSERRNGWSEALEEEMTGILRVLRTKDERQYVRCGELVSKINSALAVAGPVLAGAAAIGTGLIGGSSQLVRDEPWPALAGVVCGALAAAANTLEHGGQMGMVFEQLRNCAGYYRRLAEEIEENLGESDVERREDGELFEMKMALQLGRSRPYLKGFASYASCEDEEDVKEFAGKLF